jgi:hypothetical protein
MLHYCKMLKHLQHEELLSLATTAGCEPLPDGRCFLCKRKVREGQPHRCSSILWRLFAIDHSQLPHANPAEDPRVLLQVDRVDIGRLHVLIHTVFM